MTRLLASFWNVEPAGRGEPVPSCDELERKFARLFGEFPAGRPVPARLSPRR